jgi:hypothetical protein
MRNPTISAAIREKRLLQFTYEGVLRLVEPHVYGESQDGGGVMRGWQRSPHPTGWKLFRDEKISSIKLSDIRFDAPRAGYQRGDKSIRPVYAAL